MVQIQKQQQPLSALKSPLNTPLKRKLRGRLGQSAAAKCAEFKDEYDGEEEEEEDGIELFEQSRELERTPTLNKSQLANVMIKTVQTEPFQCTTSSELISEQQLPVRALHEVEAEFKLRYPHRKDMHLRAVKEHLDILLESCNISALPFSHKSFSAVLIPKWRDGLLQLFDPEVLDSLVELMSAYPHEVLAKLYSQTLIIDLFRQQLQQQIATSPLQPLTKSFSSILMLQLMLRNGIRSAIDDLHAPIHEFLSLSVALQGGGVNGKSQQYQQHKKLQQQQMQFRSNPALGNTLLWILGQCSNLLREDELRVWFTLCMPAYDDKYCMGSTTAFQDQSLDVMEMLLSKDPAEDDLLIMPSSFCQLLDYSHSNKSLLTSCQRGLELKRRLMGIYQTVKAKTFDSMEFRVDDIQLFHSLNSLLTKCDHKAENELITEIAELISKLMKRNKQVFKVWENKLNMDNTRLILNQFKESNLVQEHLDNPDFYTFIKVIDGRAALMDNGEEVKQIAKTILLRRDSVVSWSWRSLLANFVVGVISIGIVLLLALVDEEAMEIITQKLQICVS